MIEQPLQMQIDQLKVRLDSLDQSSSISRNFETALRERLGLATFSAIISGTTVISSGSSVDIVDARIKSTSVVLANSQDTGNYTQLRSFVNSPGVARVAVTSPSVPININYIIIV